MRTTPRDLAEASRVYRLSRWQRFRRLELPVATTGLVWNGMLSMGGAWFFLVASEDISVNNQTYTLPGIGSYVGVAINEQNLGAIGWAIVTMIVVVVLVDRLFWRPLVAWSERFKIEESEAGEVVESASSTYSAARVWPPTPPAPQGGWSEMLGRPFAAAGRRLARLATNRLTDAGPARRGGHRSPVIAFQRRPGGRPHLGRRRSRRLHRDGGDGRRRRQRARRRTAHVRASRGRRPLSALIWTPVGVWIGMNPRVSRLAQPIVQVASSFPANFLFPFVTIVFMLRPGFPIGIGSSS